MRQALLPKAPPIRSNNVYPIIQKGKTASKQQLEIVKGSPIIKDIPIIEKNAKPVAKELKTIVKPARKILFALSYTPNNVSEYCSAYAGALAGMTAAGRDIHNDNIEADYSGLAAVAGAFAQAFDTVWGAVTPNQLQVQSIQSCCHAAFQDRQPNVNAPFNEPSAWVVLAEALVALVQEGETFVTGQGITPPPFGGATFVGANDLLGSTPAHQWLAAISGQGGTGGVVPVGNNVTLEMGPGAAAGALGLIPNLPIRFRTIPVAGFYNLAAARNGSNDLDIPLFQWDGQSLYIGDDPFAFAGFTTLASLILTAQASQFFQLIVFSSNTNDGEAWTFSAPGGPGRSFTVYSDEWSYTFQTATLGESPKQWRIEYASTGPSPNVPGPGPTTLGQFAPPNQACVYSLKIRITGREVAGTNWSVWDLSGAWDVAPGTPPTLTAGTVGPTAVRVDGTAGAASFTPSLVLLGDGFVSLQGTVWDYTVDVAWVSHVEANVGDVPDVSFALAPAPAWGL